jgi:chromosome segregation ATPase
VIILHPHQGDFVRRFINRVAVAALVAVLAPAAASAQQGDPTQLPPEAQELIAELQQLQAQIQPIQQQALQDPEIQAAQEKLGEDVQAAMAEEDPAVPEHIERLETVIASAQAAQAEEDEARMAELVAEAQQIEQRLQAAQTKALELPEIAPRVEAFQKQLQAKMVEVEPESESLLERFEELNDRLAVLMGG